MIQSYKLKLAVRGKVYIVKITVLNIFMCLIVCNQSLLTKFFGIFFLLELKYFATNSPYANGELTAIVDDKPGMYISK